MVFADLTDSEAISSDWGSDDEPPWEQPLDTVIISPEMHALKYIIVVGKEIEKPFYGDRVLVQWIPLRNKLFDEKRLVSVGPSYIDSGEIGEVLETALKNQGTESQVELGYNDELPYIVEETITTMRRDELSIVFRDNNELWTGKIPQRLFEKQKKEPYEIYQKKHKKEYRKCLRTKSSWSDLETCRSAYGIWLKSFQKIFAFNNDRSILHEPVVVLSSANASPEENDVVYYTWRFIVDDSDAVEEYKTEFYIGSLTPELAIPRPYAFDVLLRMKCGEKWKVHLREYHDIPSKTFYIELHTIHMAGYISVKEYSSQSFMSSPTLLNFKELVPSCWRSQQKTAVEDGCRIAALVSIRYSKNTHFIPFHSRRRINLTDEPASLVSWTVGTGSVPYWLDNVVERMKIYSRILVQIASPTEFFAHFSKTLALWDVFCAQESFQYSVKNKDTSDLFSWTHVYLFTHADLCIPIKRWVESAPVNEAFQLFRRSTDIHDHLFVPREDLDITYSLQCILNSKYSSGENSHTLSSTLNNLICQPEFLAYWDHATAESLSTVEESCFVDIQLVQILERMEKSWTYTEEQRFQWSLIWKRFGNFLYNKQMFDLALTYYKKAIEVIRFSYILDAPQNLGVTSTSPLSKIQKESQPDALPNVARNSTQPIQQLHEALFLNVIQVYIALQLWSDAVIAAQQCLQIRNCSTPTLAKANYRLALAYFHLESYSKSRENVLKCLTYIPGQKAALELLDQLKKINQLKRVREKSIFYNIFKENPT